ncbi:MAG: cadherin domain-containing protein [Silicimonas sp.]|nr:cadherin domain-containing protein [Silicimonas sp.]
MAATGRASGAGRKGRAEGQAPEFAPSEGADFQISIGTATSIAGLTAFSLPAAEAMAADWVPEALSEAQAAPSAPDTSGVEIAGTGNLPPATSTEIDSAPAPVAPRTSEGTHESIVLPPEPGSAAPSAPAEPASVAPAPLPPSLDPAPFEAPPSGAAPAPVEDEADDGPGKSTWSPNGEMAATMAEDCTSGTKVFDLARVDSYGDPIRYLLTDAQGRVLTESPFEITEAGLMLAPGGGFDFETAPEMTVYVTATTEVGTSGPWPVQLTITDVNEGPSLAAVDGSVAENASGAVVGAVTGSDPDAGDVLSYSVDDARFEVVGGQLRLKDGVSLDHETDAHLDVAVTVTDSAGLSDTRVVRVTVGDVNEGPSVTASDGTIAENAAGTTVGSVTATDPDAGDTVTLSVDDARFEIVGGDLRLKDGVSLDYEDGASVSVTVTATDSHGATDTHVVTVSVSDTGEVITLGDGGESFVDTGVAETSVTGGAGADTITGHDNGAVLDGGAGADELTGGAGDDVLTGGAGDDTIAGGDGADTAVFDGDLADFAISYDSGSQTFTITDQNTGDGDEGTDTVTGVETFTFNGTDYTVAELIDEAGRQANSAPTDITHTGGSLQESVAEAGDVGSLQDPSGSVVAVLSASDDAGDNHSFSLLNDASGHFEIVGNEIRVRAGQTIDHEATPSFDVTVRVTDQYGATYDEVITLNVQDAGFTYAAGNTGETITGSSEEDTITGGSGADVLHGGAGDDSLVGGDGNDQLHAGSGSDTLEGGAGGDVISVEHTDGTVVAHGGAGSDELDFLHPSGDGGFTATFSGTGAGAFNANNGSASGTFTGIEAIGGTGWDDSFDASADGSGVFLDGEGGDDTLIGGSGADTIHADSGDDSVVGGAGNDEIHAGSGTDTIEAGAGDDFIEVEGSDGTLSISGGADHDIIDFDGPSDSFSVNFIGSGSGIFSANSNTANGAFSDIEQLQFDADDDYVNATLDTSGLSLGLGEGDDTAPAAAGRTRSVAMAAMTA